MAVGLKFRRWLGARILGSHPLPLRGSTYAAAQSSRLLDDWYPSLQSADREIKASLRTARARSRQLFRDNPHTAAFFGLVKTNVIGPHGVRMQSRITTLAGNLRKKTNQAIEDGFLEWGQAETASADGRLSWIDLQELFVGTCALDGEFLARERRGYPNKFGYAIQVLDADQLDEYFNRPPAPGQNEIRMGVEVNADQRPVAYHIWDGHPWDLKQRGERKRIPASEIIHQYIALRPGQTRGFPWLSPVMFRLALLDGLEEAEIVASRSAAAKPVYFKVTAEGISLYDDDKNIPDTPIVEDVEPATAKQLPPGLEPVQMDPKHPTTAFPGFHKAILRTIASGAGVAYVSLTGDLEGANYGSQRGGLLLERDQWRRLQCFAIRGFHSRVFRSWLTMAASVGAVQLPSMDVQRWMAPVWQPRGWPWIDPAADLEAAEKEILLGINNRQALCGERGRDYEDNLAALKEEQELARAAGVDVSGSEAKAKDTHAPKPSPQPARPRVVRDDLEDEDDEDDEEAAAYENRQRIRLTAHDLVEVYG